MTGAESMAATWLALAAALLLAPAPSPESMRVHELAGTGRLHAVPRSVGRWRPGAGSAVACCAAVGAVVFMTAGPVLAVAAVITAATAAQLGVRAVAVRRADRAQAQLLAGLRLLVGELEAGATPSVAFAAAAEITPVHAPLLRSAAQRCAAGDDPDLDRSPLAALGHAWRLAAVAGAPLAAVCGRVADDLAARIDQRHAVGTALAAARSSAGLLAVLPVLGIALGSAMQARPLHILTATPSGQLVCLLGVTLDAAGLLWTQWLTARAER